ncbi:Acyl-CoA N-acyltransferase [Penicillium sp. IBT 31633x]|nr:Acyl-CoA N-acyltransferase [Penicillium sp. IBT 31633x]
MPFAIQPCVPEDAPGLAAAIVAARLNDPHWTSLWKDPSAESQIAKTTDCIPWSLVTSTDTKRHQKVIDVESGQVAGYARWCLPPILVTRGDVWLDARVAEGTTADRAAYEKQCQEQTQNGQFKGLKDEDQIRYRTAPVEEADARIRRDGHFLSKMHIKAGLKLYLSLGFQLIETVSVDYSKYGGTEPMVTSFLVREPLRASSVDM